jgi:endoglucanase
MSAEDIIAQATVDKLKAEFGQQIQGLVEQNQTLSRHVSELNTSLTRLSAVISELTAGTLPVQPTPTPEQPAPSIPDSTVTEPEIPNPPHEVGYPAPINNFSNNDWNRGVWLRDRAGVSIPLTSANQTNFIEGATVRLANGDVRKITYQQLVGNNISIFMDGDRLDPEQVGYPHEINAVLSDYQPDDDQPTDHVPPTDEEVVQPTPTPKPEGELPLRGMNVAGLGNNPALDAINGIGVTKAGTHYRKPEEKLLVGFVKKLKPGESWIARLPIAGERLISVNGEALYRPYLDEIIEAMDLIHKYQGKVVIDLHNYFRWWAKVSSRAQSGRHYAEYHNHLADGIAMWTVIGEPDCPISYEGLADFWQRLATVFKDHPALLGYGLMNEPHYRNDDKVDVNSKWPIAAQMCIDTIRKVDRNTFILIGGNAYSSAKLWPSQSDNLKDLHDPSDRLLYEAHQYMDKQGNGGGQWKSLTDPVTADQGVKDWSIWINWLKTNKKRGFAGEFGGPATAGYLIEALDALYDLFDQHNIPSTQWLSGPGFGDNYANGMNKADGTIKENANPLLKRIGKTCNAYGPL